MKFNFRQKIRSEGLRETTREKLIIVIFWLGANGERNRDYDSRVNGKVARESQDQRIFHASSRGVSIGPAANAHGSVSLAKL